MLFMQSTVNVVMQQAGTDAPAAALSLRDD